MNTDDTVTGCALALFLGIILAGIAVLGVSVWAVIELVQWVTSK